MEQYNRLLTYVIGGGKPAAPAEGEPSDEDDPAAADDGLCPPQVAADQREAAARGWQYYAPVNFEPRQRRSAEDDAIVAFLTSAPSKEEAEAAVAAILRLPALSVSQMRRVLDAERKQRGPGRSLASAWRRHTVRTTRRLRCGRCLIRAWLRSRRIGSGSRPPAVR